MSNVGSGVRSQSSVVGGKSAVSTTSSVPLQAEADLAALMARQKILKDMHELEEQEEQLRKKKEQLKLDEEIAAQMAKLDVLRTRSILSGRSSRTKHSDGMNSYLEKQKLTSQPLRADAKAFVPQMSTKPKENNKAPQPHSHSLYARRLQAGQNADESMYVQQQDALGVNTGSGNVDQNNMLAIMGRQNEITSLLIQQQSLSSLPRREIPIFDGDPLKYHAFIKDFENGVEANTESCNDRLYYLEQYTSGLPKQLIRSCQHLDPVRGYAKAQALLSEHFGNEQKVAAAYMEKALSWPPIKTDVKALQDYSLFLRGCSNAMEDMQYLHDLDMPANMLTIIKKLPYKYRDKWRSAACELQERRGNRATFNDITNFTQVRFLTDPVFGNIQDAP